MGDRLDFETLEEDTLQPYRELGDPLADDVVDAIFRAGEITAVRNLLRHLVDSEEFPSRSNAAAGLTQEVLDQVTRFLELSQSTIQPLDSARIVRGEEFFAEHGPEILMILAMYSLP